MPRDNEAPGGTRSLHRVELAAKLAVRDASAAKGGMLSNFYEERTPKVVRIVKRPGVEPAGTVGAGCGGQGFTEFNGSLLTVACDTLYKQHMVGLHAFVTLAHFPPGDTAEGTGSNRYKFKFRPDQCDEHVWSDPCDEDRESGDIDTEENPNYRIMGIDGNTGKPFSFYTASGSYELHTPTGLATAVASGTTTYGALVGGTNFKIFDKSWNLVGTFAVGFTPSDIEYLAPYYYLNSDAGTTVKRFTEAGAAVDTITVTSTMNYLGTDSTGFVYCIGRDSASEDFYNIEKISPAGAVVAIGTFDSGNLNSAVNTACNVTATETAVYIYAQVEDGSFVNHPYLAKFNTSLVEQSSYDMTPQFPTWSSHFRTVVMPDFLWAVAKVSSNAKFAKFTHSLSYVSTVTIPLASLNISECLHRDYYY